MVVHREAPGRRGHRRQQPSGSTRPPRPVDGAYDAAATAEGEDLFGSGRRHGWLGNRQRGGAPGDGAGAAAGRQGPPRERLRARARGPPARGAPADPGGPQWMVNPREDVDATLEEAAKGLQRDGVEVEIHAREGDPADAILDVAEEQGADLIVVGNKGMTGAKRFLLGQRAEQGLASRSLQRDDHPDDLASASAQPVSRRSAGAAPPPRSRGPGRSGRRSRAARGRGPWPRGAPPRAPGSGSRPAAWWRSAAPTIAAHVRARHRGALVAARQPEAARRRA